MSNVSLPEARLASSTRFERLRSRVVAGLRFMKRPIKWLAIALAVPLVAWGGLYLFRSWRESVRAEDAREAAQCARYNNVRIEGITRLQAVHRMNKDTGEIYLKAWRVFSQPNGSASVDMHDNSCNYSFVADVPAGQSMWAIQTSEWRSDRCMCWIEYHVRSMSDPAISTVERDIH